MNQTILDLGENVNDGGFEIACGERPQQRQEHFGVAALSDTELVATLLQGNGTRAERAMETASHLIAEAGSIAGLAAWHPTDYRRVKGIGRSKAMQLSAVAEIARRMIQRPDAAKPLLNRADLIAAHLAPRMTGLQVEKFLVLCLNRKNRLLKVVEITSGTATAALAHPREVFRAAIREGSAAIVCAHNHPSGDPAPSAPDLQVTRQLREGAKTVDIELLDHVIVGTPSADPLGAGYFSFRQSGML